MHMHTHTLTCTHVPRIGADSAFTPWFAIGAALWAMFFLKTWRRAESGLTFRWNVEDFDEEEPIRPSFLKPPTTYRKGFYTKEAGFLPLGDVSAPYFPAGARASRVMRAFGATAFIMFLVAIGCFSIMAFKLLFGKGE